MSEKMQDQRKVDGTDDEPDPTGDSRFDFYPPISASPAIEPVEFMAWDKKRRGTHAPK